MSGKDVYNLLGGTKLTQTTDPSDSVFSGPDWLHNLQGPVQNENTKRLVQKVGKSAIKILKQKAFSFFPMPSLNLS